MLEDWLPKILFFLSLRHRSCTQVQENNFMTKDRYFVRNICNDVIQSITSPRNKAGLDVDAAVMTDTQRCASQGSLVAKYEVTRHSHIPLFFFCMYAKAIHCEQPQLDLQKFNSQIQFKGIGNRSNVGTMSKVHKNTFTSDRVNRNCI